MTSISTYFYLLSPFSYEKAGKMPGTVVAVYPDGEDASSTCGNEERGLGGAADFVWFEGLTGKRVMSTHSPDETIWNRSDRGMKKNNGGAI